MNDLKLKLLSEFTSVPLEWSYWHDTLQILSIYPYQGRLHKAVSMSRPKLRILTSILTAADSPLCRSCGDAAETLAHLFANYPVLDVRRRIYLGVHGPRLETLTLYQLTQFFLQVQLSLEA